MKINHFIDLLDFSDSELIQQVYDQLIGMGANIIPDLIESLSTASIRQSLHIIDVLAGIGDEQASDAICNWLLTHKNLIVRSKAAEVLGNFSGDKVADTLIESLKNTQENEMVTMWVVTSLGTIPTLQTNHALLDYLQQPISSTMRYMTIRALGEQGNSQAIDHILPYVNDDDRHVRHDCEIALQKLGHNISSEANR